MQNGLFLKHFDYNKSLLEKMLFLHQRDLYHIDYMSSEFQFIQFFLRSKIQKMAHFGVSEKKMIEWTP